jgi:hypothetical protein
MKWDVITKMSQSPSFPAQFIAQSVSDKHWYIADPSGHLGTGFWYVGYDDKYICLTQPMDIYFLIMHFCFINYYSQHSAVYIMDWMDKEFPLKSSDVGGVST